MPPWPDLAGFALGTVTARPKPSIKQRCMARALKTASPTILAGFGRIHPTSRLCLARRGGHQSTTANPLGQVFETDNSGAGEAVGSCCFRPRRPRFHSEMFNARKTRSSMDQVIAGMAEPLLLSGSQPSASITRMSSPCATVCDRTPRLRASTPFRATLAASLEADQQRTHNRLSVQSEQERKNDKET